MNLLEKNVRQFQHHVRQFQHQQITSNKTTTGLTKKIALELNTTTETVST